MIQFAAQVCMQVGIADVVVHMEEKLSEGPQLIELNGRMGGMNTHT